MVTQAFVDAVAAELATELSEFGLGDLRLGDRTDTHAERISRRLANRGFVMTSQYDYGRDMVLVPVADAENFVCAMIQNCEVDYDAVARLQGQLAKIGVGS